MVIRAIAEDLCTRQLGYRMELDGAEAKRREVTGEAGNLLLECFYSTECFEAGMNLARLMDRAERCR